MCIVHVLVYGTYTHIQYSLEWEGIRLQTKEKGAWTIATCILSHKGCMYTVLSWWPLQEKGSPWCFVPAPPRGAHCWPVACVVIVFAASLPTTGDRSADLPTNHLQHSQHRTAHHGDYREAMVTACMTTTNYLYIAQLNYTAHTDHWVCSIKLHRTYRPLSLFN